MNCWHVIAKRFYRKTKMKNVKNVKNMKKKRESEKEPCRLLNTQKGDTTWKGASLLWRFHQANYLHVFVVIFSCHVIDMLAFLYEL